jgi:hypothetical protein
MRESFVELQQARQGWSSCNIHQLATRVQQNAERMFDTTFEVISGNPYLLLLVLTLIPSIKPFKVSEITHLSHIFIPT